MSHLTACQKRMVKHTYLWLFEGGLKQPLEKSGGGKYKKVDYYREMADGLGVHWKTIERVVQELEETK